MNRRRLITVIVLVNLCSFVFSYLLAATIYYLADTSFIVLLSLVLLFVLVVSWYVIAVRVLGD